MYMTAVEIAQTLQTATEGKDAKEVKVVVHRLVGYLKETRRLALLPEILKEAEVLLSRAVPQLTVASDEEASRLRDHIVQAILDMGARVAPSTTKDPSLISGFTLSYKGNRLDHSGKRRLIDLYATLTA